MARSVCAVAGIAFPEDEVVTQIVDASRGDILWEFGHSLPCCAREVHDPSDL